MGLGVRESTKRCLLLLLDILYVLKFFCIFHKLQIVPYVKRIERRAWMDSWKFSRLPLAQVTWLWKQKN